MWLPRKISTRQRWRLSKRLLQFVEHLALGLGNLVPQPQDAAGGLSDLSGQCQHVVFQFGNLFRRQSLAERLDVVLPSLQHLSAGLFVQPVFQQRIVAVTGLDAGLLSRLDDCLALFGLDLAVRPGDLNQRNHGHRGQRFGFDLQFDQPIQHRFVVDPACSGQLGPAVLFLQAFAEFVE